jgi:DNA modification methylase
VDLRHEQIEANNEQAKAICDNDLAKWYVGDSRDIGKILKNKQADLIFSCPPYGDLEVYSDDPKDISTLKYEEFRQAYFDIIKKTTALLKDNRFACFVVGEFRSKNNGTYQNFVSDTIQAFTEAGLNYYNEAILVTVCGTLPIRAGRQFQQSRKIGKTHQNVLIFVKGDPLLATQACGNVELTDLGIVEEDDIADDDLGVEEL